jgi:hypothetical protein
MTSRIIGLWSTPRSVSTALEKAFAQRQDAIVIHEPYTDSYYFGSERRSARYGSWEHLAHRTGSCVTRSLLEYEEPIFFKELAFQGFSYVDDAFLRNVTSTFIVRHPAQVIRSLLRLKPDFTEEELGFAAMGQIFERVSDLTGRPPAVVDANRLRASPEAVLRAYCAHLGLAFDPRMLRWQRGPLRTWHVHERDSQQKWHATLDDTEGFLPPEDGLPADVPVQHQGLLERALQTYYRLSPYFI